MNSRIWITILAGGILSQALHARVVINEIYYHAPDDAGPLEYVELHNTSDQPVRLAGWKFTKGLKLEFPANATIPAGGYLVVCKDRPALRKAFNTDAAATFSQALKNGGELIELVNERGAVVDAVRFNNKSPWPAAPDGYGPSLERIHPDSPSDLPENWAASNSAANGTSPSGTPGKANSRFQANLPPVIAKAVIHPASPAPNQPITVEADVQDADGVREARLMYRLVRSGSEGAEQTVKMTKVSGNKFTGTIPAQRAGSLLRIRLQAEDERGGRRNFPDENEPRPTLPAYVADPAEIGRIPLGFIIHVDPKAATRRAAAGRGGDSDLSEEDQMRMVVWQQLRTEIDLPSVWWQLALVQRPTYEQARKLQPILAQKQAELETLINQTLQLPNIQEAFPRLPKLAGDFKTRLQTALQPVLNDEQFKRFNQWQQEKSTAVRQPEVAANAERVLQQIVPLERGFYASAGLTNLTGPQFAKLSASFQSAHQERSKFSEPVRAALQGQGDRTKLQQDVMALAQKVTTEVLEVLTPEQEPLFVARQNETPPRFSSGSSANVEPARGGSAFVFIDPATKLARVFDYVEVQPRNAGYKVRFHDDEPLNGLTGINLIFETLDRFVIAEHLAYELYRRTQCPAPASDFVRLTLDGRALGYHLLVEQPNRGFLERNRIETGGNLYKLLWYGEDIVGKHEKKNNPETGHSDLTQLISQLERARGAAQWELIRTNFNVPEVIDYFAVNLCLTHWDGFFNNYFTYHDTQGTGRWEMYPWDQDKTWGYHDGLRNDEIFWDVPVNFGMTGAVMPAAVGGRTAMGFSPGHWWRPPGYFSGPLLANPEFRKHFLARTRELLEKTYTREVFDPIIDGIGERLKDEVILRARARGENPTQASRLLATNLQLFKNQLAKRREFLLNDREIRAAGQYDAAQLK